MYFLKWIQGHNLMQAIARVNRAFKDKPGGLIVDYVGLLYDLNMLWQTTHEAEVGATLRNTRTKL